MRSVSVFLIVIVFVFCANTSLAQSKPYLLSEIRLPRGYYHAKVISNSTVLVAGCGDNVLGTFAELDLKSKRLTDITQMHFAFVWALDITAEKNWIVSGGCGGEVKLWKRSPLALSKSLSTGSETVHSAVFSRDGKFLACSGDRVRIWEMGGTNTFEVPGVKGAGVFGLAFDSKTTELFIPDGDKIVVYDMLRKKNKKPLRFSDGRILAFSVAKNGPVLFVSTDKKEHAIFDRGEGRQINFNVDCEESFIVSCFSDDAECVVAGGNNGSIMVYNRNSKRSLVFAGHPDSVVRSIEFLGKEKIVTCGDDKVLRIWDYRSILKETKR